MYKLNGINPLSMRFLWSIHIVIHSIEIFVYCQEVTRRIFYICRTCRNYYTLGLPGLLIAVVPPYHYCSGAPFTVAVAVAPLLLAESSGDSSAATFLAVFLALLATA